MNKLPQWQTGPAPKDGRMIFGVFRGTSYCVTWDHTEKAWYSVNGGYFSSGWEPEFWSEIPKDAEIEEHPQRTEYEEIRQAYQRLVGRANPRYSVGDPSDAMIPRRGLWNLLRNFARGVARQVRKKYKRKVLTR